MVIYKHSLRLTAWILIVFSLTCKANDTWDVCLRFMKNIIASLSIILRCLRTCVIPSRVIFLIVFLHSQISMGQVFQWGVNFPSYANALSIDTAGNPILGGSFQYAGDFDPGPGTQFLNPNSLDGFISKFNTSGNFQWAQQVSGAFFQQVLGTITDSSNNIYVCGNYLSSRGMVEKRNANGLVIWSNNFIINSGSYNWYIQCRAMVLDPQGNLYVTGYFRNNCYFSQNPPIVIYSDSETAFIAKIDTIGNVVWVKNTFTPTDFDDSFGNSITIDDAGDIYIVGSYSGTVDFNPDTTASFYLTSPGTFTDNSTFILKLDSAGNFIWVKEITFSTVNDHNCMTMDAGNNLLITGWAKGSADFDPGSGVYTIPGLNSGGAFVAKLDSSGSLMLVKTFSNNASGKAVATDVVGNIYLVGDFSGSTFDLDPGPAINTVVNMGWYDGFIVKLNQAGQFLWGGSVGGSGYNIMSDVKVHENGDLFFSGTFNGDHDLDPFSNVLTVSDTMNNTFLGRISQCGYSSQTFAISGCDTAYYNGIPFTSDGPHFLTYTDISGCDSTTIVDVTIYPTYYNSLTVAGCDSVVLNGQVYTNSGGYYANLISVNGCDSTIFYSISVFSSYMNTLTVEGCDSVVYDGQTYMGSTLLTFDYLTVHGCDSILVVDIIVHQSASSIQTLTGCDSVVVNGQVYTSTGVYFQNLLSNSNCDSIVQYDVTINGPTSATVNLTGCDSIAFNNQTYTSSGIYTQILSNIYGCDSLLTLNITLNNSTTSSVTISGCDSIAFNGQIFYNSGLYLLGLTNNAGCDSLINLTVLLYNINDTVIENGATLTAQTGYLYQWVNCSTGFTIIPGATNSSYTPGTNGSYAVVLNISVCTDTSACYIVTSVDIHENQNTYEWNIYYKPTTNHLILSLPGNRTKSQITLFDITGKIIINKIYLNDELIEIDVDGLAESIYTVRIIQDKSMQTEKFVIYNNTR